MSCAACVTFSTTQTGLNGRFPAQEQVGGDSKIPTIIIYDSKGRVRAVGAEALAEEFDHNAETGLIKAEW